MIVVVVVVVVGENIYLLKNRDGGSASCLIGTCRQLAILIAGSFPRR